MRELDNLEHIKPLLDFSEEGTFYFLQIMQRRKDGNEVKRHTRIIKNYYIRSEEYLDKKYGEIKDLCRFFNARACIRLNRRNYRDVSFKMMQYLSGMMANHDWEHCNKAFGKACGRGNVETKSTKTWVIDIDSKDTDILDKVIRTSWECKPIGNKVRVVLDSPNGYHLITTPFDKKEFNDKIMRGVGLDGIEFKKDNPTNLFVPKMNKNGN